MYTCPGWPTAGVCEGGYPCGVGVYGGGGADELGSNCPIEGFC